MMIDRLMQGTQLLLELGRRGSEPRGHRQHIRELLVFDMGHRDIFAHRTNRRVLTPVLDVLMNFELAREDTHHVAPFGVLFAGIASTSSDSRRRS